MLWGNFWYKFNDVMLLYWKDIIKDLAESAELIAMDYWTNLVNFVSDILS